MDAAAERLTQLLSHGLVPAVPVPHRADGSFDAEAQERYAAWMATQPIAGVAAWAHTGRGLHLEPEIAARVLASWRKALPKDKLVIAGAGARPRSRAGRPGARLTPPADPLGLTDFVIKGTVEMAADAKKLGADAILAFPPTLLRDLGDRERRIVEVHKALGDVGLPVIAFFLYQSAGGISYNERVLDRVLALPQVAGIKVATLNSVIAFQEIAPRVPEGKLLISGEDRFLAYSLMMGARTALVGLGAARTSLSASLLAAFVAADFHEFRRLSVLVDRLGAVTFREPMEGYIRRMLWVLALDGVIPFDAAYDPWGPSVPTSELDEVQAVVGGMAVG
ncbi:MAG: dihydrodipicolinate synthase family protein [Gemmatimonadetes bacterium]|nr:dihydrodipicolinate synthase family protein [Gemmatimonadota bacterium]